MPRYKHLSQRNQILKRPGQHIGSIKTTPKTVWLVQSEISEHSEQERIVEQEIMYNPGLVHIFYEVLSNAQDNYFRSAGTETPLRKIEVTISDDGIVTVWNDGLWIPTAVHEWSAEEEELEGTFYETELIFGHLNSSENYDDTDEKRIGAGLHGVGVKLTNIFSTEFSVETMDPSSGLRFYCKWTDNMENHSKPKITSLKKTKGYTKVTYKADFSRFGVDGYSSELLAVIKKLCIDCAMITGAKVVFNGERVPVKDLPSYSRYYCNDGQRIEFKSEDSAVVLCEKPEYETGLSQVSFVNGVMTGKGGPHVDDWLNGILKPLLEKIKIKFAPKGKGSKPLRLTVKNLHNYFMLFIRCNLENPEFEGQTKQVLIGPHPTVNVPTAKINQLMKWDFIADIEETIKLQSMKELKKTDGKKETHVSIPKADDANNAGKKNSSQCTLFITEGLSAKTFAVTGISAIENGRDWYGVLPVRGKVLNVRGASAAQINNNKEIIALKKMLGLQHGADYSDDAEFKKLRYGNVQILTDADADGDHIKGLLINFFKRFYPSLVSRGYLTSLRTPIVRATQGKKIWAFYYLRDFKEWAAKQKNPFKAKYYKGLGSSTDEEIHDIFQNPRYVNYIDDASADDAVDMIFSKTRTNDRKKWLENYQEQEFKYAQNKGAEIVPITQFFNNEMIGFSIYDNQRSIPSVVDGLKPSQRKAIWVALKKLTVNTESKVEQFAAKVAEETEYHHGGTSMEQAIIGLAQTFVGSNNIALLRECGQLGTRLAGGKDASAPRYIFVKLASVTRYIFRKEDDPILDYLEEEGQRIEPRFFVPIIPMLLVNGSSGIGTGYSSNIPCFNPVELVNWIRDWLDHEANTESGNVYDDYIDLTPWYWGFNGTTEKEDRRVYHYGEVQPCGKDCYQITELPVKVWIDDYKEILNGLKTGKRIKDDGKVVKYPVLVSKWQDYTTFLQAHFKVWTKPGVVIDYNNKAFELVSTETLTNMTAYTSRGGLKLYPTVEEIMREFCIVRYAHYQKRKEHLLSVHRESLKTLDAKKQFIAEVLSNFKLLKQTKNELCTYLESKGYYKNNGNYKYLIDMPIKSFTTDKIAKLNAEIQKIKKDILFVKNTTPKEMWIKELDEFLVAYQNWKSEIEKMRKEMLKKKIKRKKT